MLVRLAIFLGAFLLFAVQPLIGRAILPLFGGGAGVWLACMLFFQVALLAGYGYAHGLVAGRSPVQGMRIHAGLLVLAWLALAWPMLFGTAPWLPAPGMPGLGISSPSLAIFVVLCVLAGFPMVALSATSPLVQALYARSGGVLPYRLYAVSNWGSMAGLVVYPLLMEPGLTLSFQARLAAGLFGLHGIIMLRLFWSTADAPTARTEAGVPSVGPEGDREEVPLLRIASWIGLSTLGSLWLMAVSNKVATDVASMPLMWVLPLGIYLLTFILAFDARWPVTNRAWTLSMISILLVFGGAIGLAPVIASLGALLRGAWPSAPGVAMKAAMLLQGRPLMGTVIALSALFAAGLLAHGRLADTKPGPRKLTLFYLCVSLGGCLGGLATSFLAPNLFNQNYELPLGLLASAGLLIVGHQARKAGARRLTELSLASICAALALVRLGYMAGRRQDFFARDFYGSVELHQPHASVLSLVHGTTTHGLQFIKEPLRSASYYGEGSAIGRVLRWRGTSRSSLHVGVVGLGVGNVAAYGRLGDTYHFIEISPKIIDLSGPKGRAFTVLRSTPARVEVTQGDGRLALESYRGDPFDVLLIDAFAGGHIPTHLLTAEAIRTYLRCLKPDGQLLLHVSHHLPLAEQVGATLESLKLPALLLLSEPVLGQSKDGSRIFVEASTEYWVISPRPEGLYVPELMGAAKAATSVGSENLPLGLQPLNARENPWFHGISPWTDERNSLTTLLFRPSR